MASQPQCGNPGLRHLLVFVTLHTRYANTADDVAMKRDRNSPLDGKRIGKIDNAGTLFDGVLPCLARPVRDGSRAGFQRRHFSSLRAGAICAFKQQQQPGSIWPHAIQVRFVREVVGKCKNERAGFVQ